jgi:hypothetical protein
MKKYLFSLILVLVSYVGFSQKGLSYQAVILDPNAIEVPGQDIAGQPLVNGDVWIKFSIYNGSTLQFEEVQKTKTDAYGLVNLMIGSVSTASFNALVWDASQKTLQVYVSFNQGASYTKVSDQKLNYNPYALYAETAEKLGGVLAISGGGTGATAAADARLNLGLGNVDNTSDAAKPVSTATKAALDLKANATDVNAGLALKANSTEVTAALALKANTTDMTAALAAKADTGTIKTFVVSQVAAATIADADANTKGKIKLSGDLAGTADAPTVPALALKANTADVTTGLGLKANTSDMTTALALKANSTDVTTALSEKADTAYVLTKVAAATIADSDANTKGKIKLAGDLAGTAAAPTVPGLALKLDANQKGVANGVASLNALGIIPSSQLPPVTLSSTSVVGSDADMIALSSATVGSIAVRTDVNKNYVLSAIPASILSNWIELLTPAAPVQAVNGYTGSVNLAKSDVGLSNVDNTSDVSKPVSNPTQAALNLKLDANKVGAASGVASLNALGKIPTDQIPAISFSSVKVLTSQADMLALSTAVIGSVVIRTDVNKNYVLAAANPAVLSNWIELLTPAPPVQTVNGMSGNISLAKSDLGLGNVDNTSDANKPISMATQTALDLKANSVDITSALNLKANIASPTFTGTVTTGSLSSTSITAPTYASTPKTLTYTGSTINWNPAQGLNAAITLTQNSDLSFTTAPPIGSYGTVVLTQDGTGGRTLSLPVVSGATNKVLGSTSTSTVALSSAANSKDILNFYYDGTNCYWNIGQGYGAAATSGTTNLATGITGTLGVANGGTGATTITGIVKGNGTSAMTAAVAGTDYQAPLTLTTSGTGAATLLGNTLNIPAVSSTVNAGIISGTIAIANGGTGATTATAALTSLGAAPLASPTFTGTVTTSAISAGALSATSVNTPIYASTPQVLTPGTSINWDPALGLNASVTLAQNSTLSFTSTPTAGAYGTLVVTQGTGGNFTLTLPSTTNKVLGSTSSTTVALSTSAGAKDIVNFYFDGTNCYWNVGQGYGSAATIASTNLATSVSGTLPVANGGTGATTLTGLLKGTGTSALTAAVAGTDYLAPNGSAASLTNFPTLNQNTTGNAATVTTNANLTGDVTSVGNSSTVVKINGTSLANLSTGILKNTTSTGVPTIAVAGTDYQAPITLTTTGTGAATLSGTTLNIPAVSSTVNASTISGTVGIANGGTGLSTTPANGQIDIGNGTGFTRATLTAGTAITITNTAGTITIAAAVRPTTDQFTATSAHAVSSATFTLSQTPLNTKVWMFINGIRTNNSAYTISGTTVTYTAASNNNYTIVVGDRIQFDYAY